MKTLLTAILITICIHYSGATVRYVSHEGTNTPPYTTWETAADSIMFAINVSTFGDTIYVANGVYEEVVTMISGLSLIGAGMDSCVIDTRNFVNSQNFKCVKIASNCLFTGFHIIIYNRWDKGVGISYNGSSQNSVILHNRISNGYEGIYLGSNSLVYENIINNCTIGIGLFNSNEIVRKNIVYTEANSTLPIVAGVDIQAFDYTYKPIIDSNLVYTTHAYGIHQSYGAKPVITNNIFLLDGGGGMFLGYSDTVKVYNNLIYGKSGGITNVGVENLLITNNYIGGELSYGIKAGWDKDIIENNVITNTDVGIERYSGGNVPIVKYNNLWRNNINYSGFAPADTTSLFVDPMVVNTDTSQGALDLHLQMFSPLIDRGDPDVLDRDGSRSDIGLYGGPFGEIYQYQDLAPRAPVNLTAHHLLDTTKLHLKWNRNTESDISHYNLYRDTTENFTADSTTLVISVTDTFYLSIVPENMNSLYFKLTAVDNQGNESEPSEELHVVLTGTIKNEQFKIDNYRLYQNYPNPFNPSTRIGYRLKQGGYVKLYVYDIKGELVQTLVNQYQEGGYYEVEFSGGAPGTNQSTSTKHHLASGVYIYQLILRDEHNVPIFSDIKKMIYMK